jgi:hypothetical protein
MMWCLSLSYASSTSYCLTYLTSSRCSYLLSSSRKRLVPRVCRRPSRPVRTSHILFYFAAHANFGSHLCLVDPPRRDRRLQRLKVSWHFSRFGYFAGCGVYVWNLGALPADELTYSQTLCVIRTLTHSPAFCLP